MSAAPLTLAPVFRAWAFIGSTTKPPAGGYDVTTSLSLPGATKRFTEAQIHDRGHAVDWLPAAHATPPAVGAGRGGAALACGYCHLAGGERRVENASLAGLPSHYIREQVAAFAAGTRIPAAPDYLPSRYMAMVAKAVSSADLAAAAAYFAAAPYTSHVHVVEAATVPTTVADHFVLTPTGARTEPIAGRIVEMPDDVDAFEKRDPRVTYTAFVPPDSVQAGKAVVAHIGCPACHGAGMKL